MKYIKQLTIDIDKKNNEVVQSVQYDSKTRFIHINLISNAMPFDITGCSVKVSGIKSDNTGIFNNCTVLNAKEGFIEVEVTEQINAVEGLVKCELKIYDGKGVLTTKQFNINVTSSVSSKTVESSNEFGALTEALNKVNNIDNKFNQLTSASVKEATKTEIEKLVSNGTIANLTLADGSVTSDKLGEYSVTQEKIHPNVKLGVQINDNNKSNTETWSSNKIDSISLKVRDLQLGEGVINIANITGDKYQEALFDFTKLTSEDTKISDINNENKFFNLDKVEPREHGAYALGYNGQMMDNPERYAVGLVFTCSRVNRTGIFKFNGDGNTAFNFDKNQISITHTSYYGSIPHVPVCDETFMFMLIGLDMPNDVMNVWINGVNKGTFSLGGRKVGNMGYLNKGYWADGTCVFNKIALFNKPNFTNREIKAITEYMFTVPQYLNVDNSKSFLSVKNGLVRHITMKNVVDGVVKDVVYTNNEFSTSSVDKSGFVLSERKLIPTKYSFLAEGGGVFIRFDKNSNSNNQYILNYDNTNYLWVNFANNRICGRQGSYSIIAEREVTFNEKNVLFIGHDKKVYLNGVHIYDINNIELIEPLFREFKNDYPIKDYVWYAKELSESDIKTISNELCGY